MITRAYIHDYGNNKIEPEHLDVKQVLEKRGVHCELFTVKKIHRNQLKLDKQTLVVGDHPTIKSVLKRLGYAHQVSTYPESIRSFLHRSVWEKTAGELISEGYNKEISNVFIKPKFESKLFTGFVIHSSRDVHNLLGIPKSTELFVSTVVEWESEFRVFINDSIVVGVRHYEGDINASLDMRVVENAILEFEKSKDKVRAYSLDFGVLSTGETTLIEWNDGYALGSYGLDPEIYTDLIVARWNEILETCYED